MRKGPYLYSMEILQTVQQNWHVNKINRRNNMISLLTLIDSFLQALMGGQRLVITSLKSIMSRAIKLWETIVQSLWFALSINYAFLVLTLKLPPSTFQLMENFQWFKSEIFMQALMTMVCNVIAHTYSFEFYTRWCLTYLNGFLSHPGKYRQEKHMFSLGETESIEGVQIYAFNDEGEMLSAWRLFVIQMDPDILTGFNVLGFDLPYLLQRAHGLSPDFGYTTHSA